MIRIVIENLFVFLLPTLLYVGWVAFRRNDWPGLFAVLKAAPLVYLFISGAVMMLIALLAFSSRTGHKPGEGYVPPSFDGGKFEPGHSTPTGATPTGATPTGATPTGATPTGATLTGPASTGAAPKAPAPATPAPK